MDEEKVTEIMDRDFFKHGSVWIELNSGTQFEVVGTDCKIFGSTLKIYNKNKLAANVYLDDIRYMGTMEMII